MLVALGNGMNGGAIMKRLLNSIFLGIIFSSYSVHAAVTQRPAFRTELSSLVRMDTDGISHFVLTEKTPAAVKAKISAQGFVPYYKRDNDPLVFIEHMVNLGQKLWKIVVDNKPVVNIRYTYANALPKGVESSEDLDGFSDLQYRSLRLYGKNSYGLKVYDLTYTLVHRYGGSYRGRGSYLENIAIIPQRVEVLWGYKLNLEAKRVTAVNVGTRENPIAGLAMEMGMRVSTPIKDISLTRLYEFRGDSAQVRDAQ